MFIVNNENEIGSIEFNNSKKIFFSKNIRRIRPDILWEKSPVEEFVVEDGNKFLKAVDGVIFSANGEDLILFPRTKKGEYVVPNGVKTIKSTAFHSSELTSIKFNEDLETIEQYAFTSSKLESSEFPRNCKIKVIKCEVFAGTNIKNICLPSSLESIGQRGFYHCKSLKEITISANIKILSAFALAGCESLAKVTIEGAETKIDKYAFTHCFNLKEVISPCSSTLKKVLNSIQPITE